MKLVNLGHAQSKATRLKIAAGVRKGWQRRREKLLLQETLYFHWQNLIAEASKNGLLGEEGLEWDSYKILDEQIEQEWLESIEQRKKALKPIGNKRASKPLEQRRKISEAISAKWNDPGYRDRVCSALAKYHGIIDGVERKTRRSPNSSSQTKRRNPANKMSDVYASIGSEMKSQSLQRRMKRRAPLYKDPLASSKLQMIKNIRAERAAAETKKTETIERARLLIAEAEKAAKALEVAALRSPLARTSLVETRKLINEAIHSIESIDAGLSVSHKKKRAQYDLTEPMNYVENELVAGKIGINGADQIKVNGTRVLHSSDHEESCFGKFTVPNLLDEDKLFPISLNGYAVPLLNLDGSTKNSDSKEQLGKPAQDASTNCKQIVALNGAKPQSKNEEMSTDQNTSVKKWIRGKLVEVAMD